MRHYQHIYLSPHYDDAALSCGGSIHQQARAGQPGVVMTLFAAPPDAPLSPLARQIHAHMATPDDVIAARRCEDRAALDVLGADPAWLGFHDAIYRARPAAVGPYTDLVQLFEDITAHERALAEDIAGAVAARLAGASGVSIHAPLGVGHHVDHQIGNRVGWSLARRGWTVDFYEDFPYCEPGYVQPVVGRSTGSLGAALDAQPERLAPRESPITDDDLDARIRSVQAYRSQLELVFGDPGAVAGRITHHARSHGGPRPVERFWSLPAQGAQRVQEE